MDSVLVVDDTPSVLNALALLIRSRGMEPVCVRSGAEALDRLPERAWRLMLLDLQMPGMSGWDVLRAIRADARFGSLNVVICSTHQAHLYRDRALREGAAGYIDKTEAAEELPELLDQLRHEPRALGSAPA